MRSMHLCDRWQRNSFSLHFSLSAAGRGGERGKGVRIRAKSENMSKERKDEGVKEDE